MTNRLPFELREAVVTVIGKCFWLKDPFKDLLLSCGVSSELYDRYSEESKYKIMRHILAELDSKGDEGFIIQRRIITELANLRHVPDENIADKDEGLKALRWLKELAVAQKFIVEEEKSESESRIQEAKRKQAAIAARAQKMEQLRTTFLSMVTSKEDPQSRGYSLEDLLAELFEVNEIVYRRPYKTATEQIDGHFMFKGFDYLVEARWRNVFANEADLATFKMKVDKKLTSTRGVFFSIIGFRQEVILDFTRGVTSNIVLFDGQDLSIILEGHVSLIDGLELKIQKAAQEGIIYFPLSQRYT